MKQLFVLSLALLVMINIFGCSKSSTDAEQKIVESNEMISYLEGDGGNYINTNAPNIIPASTVITEGVSTYKILDIRSADDFAAKHIDGAVNVALKDVVTYAEANLTKADKILVTCYTGQTAGHAVLALNLMGYNAYSLKFGMSCADSTLDKWSSHTASTYSAQFTADPTPKGTAGDLPTISTGEKDGAAILKARVQGMLDAGFKGVEASAVFANISDYYIVNYFGADDYTNVKHIPGAIQYEPGTALASDADLKTLPTDKKIVVYCWTGQTSSQITAFLNVLGYDAYSLKWGVNGMAYDILPGHKWSAGAITNGFTLVP